MRKKTFLELIASVIIMIFAGGCASRPPANEVVMWLVGSEAQARCISDLAAKFTRETGIRVRCEAISWGEAHSKYLTSIAGNVPPDIGTMGLTWSVEFGALGAMVDLHREFPDDIAALEKNTFAGMWKSIKYRDRIYAIPLDMTIQVMYYRNDIIHVPPVTWRQLTALLTDLKKTGKGMLFDWGSMEWIGYSAYLWQAGGDFYNNTYTAATVNTPQAIEGMKFFTDLYKVYGVPKTPIPLEQGMRTGDFPICISGNWKIIGLTVGAPEIKGKWSIAKLPRGPSGNSTAFIGGRTMGIFSLSKNKDKAWQFIKYLYRPESQAFLYSGSVATQDAYLPPNMDSWSQLRDMDEDVKRVLIAQALEAKGPPPVLGWDSTTRFVDQAVQKIILEDAVIEDELTALEQYMNQDLKKQDSLLEEK
ncbi:MAG: extracellular solute-binding protein [Candidatus Omnitrophica bacterium]|nr:extracellular solute-binding protein [Candidatus Omnitrophota bacterium]